MDYKYSVNGIDFIAKTKDIEKELKKLKFICESRKESANMLIVTIDSKEVEEEILKYLQEFFGFYVYDFTKYDFNKFDNPNWREKYNLPPLPKGFNDDYIGYKEFSYLVKNHPTCIIGLEETRKKLDENYESNDIPKDAGLHILYGNLLNYYRDTYYKIYKSQMILFFSEKERDIFAGHCPDTYSYYIDIDFNTVFKAVIENENYSNLKDYYFYESTKNILSKNKIIK